MAKQPKPGQPKRPPADDDGDEPLQPLIDGTLARLAGRQPSPASLALARSEAPQDDLRCWNGRDEDNPDCHFNGSQNIGPVAAATLGNSRWLVLLAHHWEAFGLLGRELGSNSLLYLSRVLDAMRWALSVTSGADRAVLRRVLRAAVGLLALGTLPSPRLHSVVLSTAKGRARRETVHPKRKHLRATAAIAGNRWAARPTDGNAASCVVTSALADPSSWGLTEDEADRLSRAIRGSVADAQHIGRHVRDGGWLLGTWSWAPREPGIGWQFVISRGADWAQWLFIGPWPNASGGKPCRSVTQFRSNGEWLSVEAMAEGWSVHQADGQIVTRDNRGEVIVPALTEGELWRVELTGSVVKPCAPPS
jgi:hypothetical protein